MNACGQWQQTEWPYGFSQEPQAEQSFIDDLFGEEAKPAVVALIGAAAFVLLVGGGALLFGKQKLL